MDAIFSMARHGILGSSESCWLQNKSVFTYHNQIQGNSICQQTGVPQFYWTGCPWTNHTYILAVHLNNADHKTRVEYFPIFRLCPGTAMDLWCYIYISFLMVLCFYLQRKIKYNDNFIDVQTTFGYTSPPPLTFFPFLSVPRLPYKSLHHIHAFLLHVVLMWDSPLDAVNIIG